MICDPCQTNDHTDCEQRRPFDKASNDPRMLAHRLLAAIYGDEPITVCCCEE